MADLINLRQARKAKKRSEASDKAAANRAKFGQTKGQKARGTAESERAAKTLDHRKLDPAQK